ncbi:MAG: GNAT family N-acetyltransferase [Thermonemataceae bacterium]|nr:GNAT family N-acetyltransferase [Thermonemataceae bacterium]
MTYQYLVHRNLSTQQVAHNFEAFSFPSFVQKSKVRNLQEPFFVIEALWGKERIGAAILELLPQKKMMKVLSLKVTDTHRHKGIGSQLLKIAEQIAQNHHLTNMIILFQDNWDSIKIMPKLLAKNAWQTPQEKLVMLKLHYNQIKDLPWFQIKEYPQNFKASLWAELSPENMAYIQEKQKNENWYPEMLSPFQLPHILEKNSSLVLWHENEIVGWLITHLVTTKTIQITSLFVDNAYRNTKASIAIIANAVERFYQSEVAEQAIFMFNASNETMKTMSKKIAGEHNKGAFVRVMGCQKILV